MQNFMNGRHGVDELSTALGGLSMVLALIGSIFSVSFVGWIALIIVILALVRAFLPASPARDHENEIFLDAVSKVPFLNGFVSGNGRAAGQQSAAAADFERKKRTAQKMWDNRKTTMYFKCKNCGQILSVPRGKGRIRITCPRCGTKVEKKS